MALTLLRFLWRALILATGLVVTWFAIFKVYPYVDSRLPIFVVLLLLYIAFAYVVIPTLIRILRILDKPDHIPLYATTPDGWPSDPVNIAVIAKNRDQLTRAMKSAGWYKADESNLRNDLRALYAMILNRPYPEAPFSKLYLFGRTFDIGFEKPSNDRMSPRTRHHVRFWKLDPEDDGQKLSHFNFWHAKLKHLLGIHKEIWIGAAIEDTRLLGVRWRGGSLTHQVSVDTDSERNLIIGDLQRAHKIQTVDVVPAGEPLRFRGQTLTKDGKLICDGILTVVKLRGSLVERALTKLPTK